MSGEKQSAKSEDALASRVSRLSPLKQAVLRIDELERALEQQQRVANEPLAIVGMGCRFPGACQSPEAYWELLKSGGDAIEEIPESRWRLEDYYNPDPDVPGKMYVRHGGFLEDVDAFDARFFRISAREAASVDPQQRLLLEVGWEALEDAGQTREQVQGSETGVFIGVTTSDYASLVVKQGGVESIDSYFFSGNPSNTFAGRLSYFFGFHGPSMTVDTACSSSLVSVHLAGESLRRGECRMALAGGVNLILSPDGTIAVCRTRALAEDGRCKSFDASADGFVRSEGCGVVVLKRLSDAQADGDRILALIRGSAVNQDGATSGFTVPNGQSQQRLIRQALGTVSPSEISYVEAHGTGTSLGDPIEVKALAGVFGPGRDAVNPLYIGAAKSNIGHTEAAAGMAGLIKTILCLKHEALPAVRHFETPSPMIPWDEIPVRVCDRLIEWPRADKPRLAGVSSFGASGTNAHVVLEEAPASRGSLKPANRSYHLLTLSAGTPDALRSLVERYVERLDAVAEAESGDLCLSANAGRSTFAERLCVGGESVSEMREALKKFVETGKHSRVRIRTLARGSSPRIGFAFTGQGSQYVGMARELYDSQPLFQQTMDQCADILAPLLPVPLLDVLYPDASGAENANAANLMDQALYAQPALFALEFSLAKLFESWGVRPAMVLGHSVGEYVAACLAGVLSLEDGLTLIAKRAQLMEALPVGGGMAAIFAGEVEVVERIQPWWEELSIAAINSEQNVVISGSMTALDAAIETLEQAGFQTKKLAVSRAFHSPLIEPMLEEFRETAVRIPYREPKLAMVSNLDGQVHRDVPNADYWSTHAREAVRFQEGAKRFGEAGCDLVIELGPDRTLSQLHQTAQDDGPEWVSALNRHEKDWKALLNCLAELYLAGVKLDWARIDGPYAGERLSLPTYPFQRKRYWIDDLISKESKPMNDTQAAEGTKRRETILAALQSMMAKLLHAEIEEIDIHLPFLEAGADSLVLLDAVRMIEEEYGVKLVIRRFFEDLSTIDLVARFLDETLPAEETATSEESQASGLPKVPAAGSASVSAKDPGGLGATTLERIIAEQNRVMTETFERQLAMLRPQHPSVGGSGASNLPGAPPKEVGSGANSKSGKTVRRGAPALAAAPTGRSMPWGDPVDLRSRGLTPTQREHLESLMERFVAKTKESKRLAQECRAVLADSRATVGFKFSVKEMLYPISGTGCQGSKMRDVDGNEYIDFTMGFGVHLFGHRPAFLNEALAAELEKGVELGARSAQVGEAAKQICELTGIERAAFTNSGTEAVMAAIRLARAKTGRTKIVFFTHSYHGHSDATLVRSMGAAQQQEAVPTAPGVPQGIADGMTVLEYGSEEALDTLRAMGEEIAAVMVEPVQSRNLSLQPKAFLQSLREVTNELGAALIFDEMITGFRVHPAGAQGYFGVEADLVTYGKIIGGSMPIGVVGGKAAYLDGIDGGFWSYGDGSYPAADRTAFGGTFCQHPMAIAGALAVVNHLREQGPGLQEALNERTSRLARELNALFERLDAPIKIVWFGSVFRFEFTKNLELLFYHLLLKGVYIWEWRSCFLSTAHTEEDLNHFVKAIEESIHELRAGGFMPPASGNASKSVPERSSSGAVQAMNEYPLSTAQRQVWLATQIEESAAQAYCVRLTVQLVGTLDRVALQHALNALVARHDSLRTRIDREGGCQRIEATIEAPIRWKDLTVEEPDVSQAKELARIRSAEMQEAFDLCLGPLFRVTVIRTAEERHILNLTLSHLIADGSTVDVVIHELSELYEAALAGDKSQRSLPCQFAEYLQRQRVQLDSPEMEPHREYWKRQFESGVPALSLPLDKQRPPIKTYHGARRVLEAGPELTAALRQVSRESGATLFMTLLSAYSLLLHRLSGQAEVIVGFPVANRSFPRSETVIGYCTHLVALRSHHKSPLPFRAYLGEIRSRMFDAMEHQDYPFAELVDLLGGQQDQSGTPIASTVFNLEPVSELPGFGGLEVDWVEPTIQFTEMDLSVNVIEGKDRLRFHFDYNTDLLLEATVQRWLEGYLALLEAITTEVERPTSQLPLMSADVERTLTRDWNQFGAREVTHHCLHTPFEEQAQRTPDQVAVVANGVKTTYRDLDEQANQVAHTLRELGVGPDDRVGLCVQRNERLMVALTGILKAGGAYVPLDSSYPPARLEYMTEDSGLVAIVADEVALKRALKNVNVPVILVDRDREKIEAQSKERPHLTALPASLANVIYTSGSTGKPKGVAIEHRNLVDFLFCYGEMFEESDLEHVLAGASVSFDISIMEIWLPLWRGGTIHLAENPLELSFTVEHKDITMLQSVPSALAELVRLGAIPDSVKTIVSGGEPIQPEVARRLYAETKIEKLFNCYGPTEDTIYDTARLLDRQEEINIGVPFPNRGLYVMDNNLALLPVGVAGEFYVSGTGVARGYHDRPRLTAERFIPDPYSPVPGARMYRAGDIGKWRNDHLLECLGRTDFQLKIRGFRVEVGEIESALEQCPGVKRAVVAAIELPGGAGKQLTAYLLPEAGRKKELDEAALKEHLKSLVPGYMVPTMWMVLDKMPRTANGKVDRKRLPVPERTHAKVEADNKFESDLLKLWQEVLGRETFGVTDDFFELGGNSLLATRIVSRVRSQWDQAFTVRMLFDHPTVRTMAERLRDGCPSCDYQEVPRLEVGEHYAVSNAQRRFWIQEQIDPSGSSTPVCFKLMGALDMERVERVVDRIVERHEILRTVFLEIGGDPRQKVLSADQCRIEVRLHDCSGTENPYEGVRERFLDEAKEVMSLGEGPLWRMVFVRTADAVHYCVSTMHHIIGDGWSDEVLMSEFQTLYAATEPNLASVLPELSIQYKEFAAWLNDFLQSDEGNQVGGYWERQLGGPLSRLDLPCDHERSADAGFDRRVYSFSLEPSLATALKETARAYGATPYVSLLTCFKMLLHRYTGADDILVGTPMAGRVRAEFEQQIGPYLNVVVIRSKIEPQTRFVDGLQQVRRLTLDAQAGQLYPFDLVLERLDYERVPGRNPLFDVGFTFQNQREVGLTSSGTTELEIIPQEDLITVPNQDAEALTDLWLLAEPHESELRLKVVYNGCLFEESTIEQLGRDFVAMAKGVTAHPHSTAAEIHLDGDRNPAPVEKVEIELDF